MWKSNDHPLLSPTRSTYSTNRMKAGACMGGTGAFPDAATATEVGSRPVITSVAFVVPIHRPSIGLRILFHLIQERHVNPDQGNPDEPAVDASHLTFFEGVHLMVFVFPGGIAGKAFRWDADPAG